MVFEIELLYLVAMIATFVVLLLVKFIPQKDANGELIMGANGKPAKTGLPSGLALMASAVVGLVLYAIISGNPNAYNPRHLFEGAFGYFDTILVIITAMIFIEGLSKSGALDYVSVALVKLFSKAPTVLLIAFVIILMLPGMITGSSLSAVISVGAIVSPIMIKMGIPKGKAAAIVAFGAILGMIAPPINIPVMAICDVCDISYNGFTLPLLLLTVPVAIFAVIFLSRDFIGGIKQTFKKGGFMKDHNVVEDICLCAFLVIVTVVMFILANSKITQVAAFGVISKMMLVLSIIAIIIILIGRPYSKTINLDEMKETFNFDVLNELNWTCLIPVILLAILFVLQQVLPNIIGILATPALFVIAFIATIFVGRKTNVIDNVKVGVKDSFGAMALLMGVGMFVQVMTLNGVRGWFVVNALILPNVWQFVAIAVAVPVFGGISAFGSASILGGPFVMALLSCNAIVVASTLSLIAGLGEFLPPTAMSATFAGKQVGEENPLRVTKVAIFPLAIVLAWAMCFIVLVGPIWM